MIELKKHIYDKKTDFAMSAAVSCGHIWLI